MKGWGKRGNNGGVCEDIASVFIETEKPTSSAV